MYKLYYAPKSASMGIRAVLEEIGAPYALSMVDISMDRPRDPEYLELNPNGWVPTLVHEGGHLYEAAAITIFLTDRHPEADLAPTSSDPLRGKYLQWLVYMADTLQPAYQMHYYPFRFAASENEFSSVKARARSRLAEIWKLLDDALASGSYLLGERFSACDIYLRMLATWLAEEHVPLSEFPNAARCVARVAERPAVKSVFG